MAASSFSAQVSAWAAQTQERLTAVFRISAQDVIADMQTPVGDGGNMPVDTGFLQSSLQVGTGGPIEATMINPNPKGKFTTNDAAATLAIAGAEIGDTIYATYGAVYAKSVNYGRNGANGRLFVETAAQKWPDIVAAAAVKAQAYVEGGK